MPIWPFRKKRRRSVGKDAASQPLIDSEKTLPTTAPTAPTEPASQATRKASSPIPIPRRSSKRGRRPSNEGEYAEKVPESLDKENVPPQLGKKSSIEDITALPMSYQLQHSPHLRPVDLERPHIPYNFRNQTGSYTNIQQESVTSSPRPNTLKKKRSSYDSGTPQRRQSSRRKNDHVREEEIRAMSAQSPVPKRPGDGPLRKDSKKMRSGMKESQVSLPPPEESIHESMPGIVEQRGWEIGTIDMFNPRPAVRLSGVPQYVTSTSLRSLRSASPVSPEPVKKEMMEKTPVTQDSKRSRKRETIGARADDFDASDLRLILERDAKKRERRKRHEQEKLDQKLRGREGRNRGDSDRRRREAEELRNAEKMEQQLEAPEVPKQPTDVHPALRNLTEGQQDIVGLGIEKDRAAGDIPAETEVEKERDIVPMETQVEDPFVDPEPEPAPATPISERMPGTYTPIETPMEDPVLETAQAVRMSQASTPPLSPVHPARATSSLSQIAGAQSTREVPTPTPDESRRASQPALDRRGGTWATIFRRGGTNIRKGSEAKSPPSEASFSNTSRESMRNQPLPPHLVDTQQRSTIRRASGTPVRTQSKFREDLPELPISPPDSRVASPDVTTAAAAAAVARRAQKTPLPIDVPRHQGSTTTMGSEPPVPGRFDTPISPSLRPGTSMASVDSEGAWLASGSMKRTSRQSGLGQRRADFSSSYEDLGKDMDDQHFSRGSASPETLRSTAILRKDSTNLPGASEATSEREFFDAPEDVESPDEPADAPGTAKVHDSVRRQPTLVHRDPRVRSREGLLTEFADVEPTSATTTGRGSLEMDSDPEGPEPELQRATSVAVHTRHASSGSAKLLDMPARRASADVRNITSDPGTPKI